jgi:hypothetical protein
MRSATDPADRQPGGGPLDPAMAPDVLAEIEARLTQIRRPVSASQLAGRMSQLGLALSESPRPPRDLFLIAAATALAGAAECARRDTPRDEPAQETAIITDEFCLRGS